MRLKKAIFIVDVLLFCSVHLVIADFRTPARGPQGMVVTADRYASQIGVEILQSGGNAVDAAVAIGFALAVVHRQAGNLGGGGFMVIRFPDGSATTFDYREQAPGRAQRDMYLDQNGEFVTELSTQGYLACGVPSSVAGLYAAQRKYGKLPWRQVVEPAIRLAEKGFIVGNGLSKSIRATAEQFRQFPASAAVFLPNNEPLQEGDLWRQKDLARTLKLIAKKGAEVFYRGEIANRIADDIVAHGGLITREDLAAYRAIERPPVTGSYRGYDIISMGPPSSGGLCLLEALNILQGFELQDLPPYSAASIHLIVETMKRVYADRAQFMGDADFFPVPVATLISPDFAATRRQEISLEMATPANEIRSGDIPLPESSQTTHYSIVDAEGMAVATTTTLNGGFGAKVVVTGTGFLLNNEMDDFSAKPGTPNSYGLIGGEANAIAPGKRMLSSMAPTIIVRDHQLWAVIGTPGGSTIISQVLVALLDMIDYHMTIAEAIHAPKFHHQWLPDQLVYEPYGISADTIEKLKAMGHQPVAAHNGYGDLHGIQIEAKTGVRLGAADPRNEGVAFGY